MNIVFSTINILNNVKEYLLKISLVDYVPGQSMISEVGVYRNYGQSPIQHLAITVGILMVNPNLKVNSDLYKSTFEFRNHKIT